jgi:hypothetical protein
MYFYCVLAGCLLTRRLRWLVFGFWFAATLLLIPVLSHSPSLTNPFLAYDGARYPFRYLTIVTNPIIWEFVGGALVGLVFNAGIRLRSAFVSWTAIIIAAPICIGSVLYPAYSHGPTEWGWGFVLLVLALALASKEIDLKIHPLFVYLGNMSYTLYITHVLVMAVASQLLSQSGFDRQTDPLQFIAILVALSVLVAALSYRFLERTLSRDFGIVLQRLIVSASMRIRLASARLETNSPPVPLDPRSFTPRR